MDNFKFHRRSAEVAESGYFLFAFLSKANEKKNFLCVLRALREKYLSKSDYDAKKAQLLESL